MGAASVQTRTLPFGAEMDLVFKHSEGTRDTAITQLYLAPISIALGLVTGWVRVLHTCYAHVLCTHATWPAGRMVHMRCATGWRV